MRILFALLAALAPACADVADFAPLVPDGGADAIVSCSGDPDTPLQPCTYWMCTATSSTVRCTAHQPVPPHPNGDYTCPSSGGGVDCPANDAAGSGDWSCQATDATLTCERGQAGTPPASGYPGAGTSGAGQPLAGATVVCYYLPGTDHATTQPIATAELASEMMGGMQVAHVRLTIDPRFVDNTYGHNEIGWPRGHKLSDLAGMDYAEIQMTDRMGAIVMDFKLDYLSPDPMSASGFRSFGVAGGDGSMIVGNRSAVVATATSIDLDLNQRGYASFNPDSPATDTVYTPNPAAPDWDFRVVYDAWVQDNVFSGGVGGVVVPYLKATPSKLGQDTVTVDPDSCPFGWWM